MNVPIDIIKHGFPKECISAASEYQFLEQKVRRLIAWACSPFCSECSDCCCRKDICSESVNSFWLKLMWKMSNHDISQYDDSRGWLSAHGCLLTVGRPPVCYEYLCDKILEEISKKPHLNCLKELSRLLTLAGQKAFGNSHLVTLSSNQILTQLNFIRLRGRIARSLNVCYQHETELRFPYEPKVDWNNANLT